jgi:hypothetical protein
MGIKFDKPKKVGEQKPKEKNQPQIWVLENNQPRAIAVTVGLSDGDMNEVTAPSLKEGLPVIVDMMSPVK